MPNRPDLPIPKDEWVEFASREWCEAANRYLQAQAALHPDALDGVEWSITERWKNAPPHLGFADNVAGFWFTISGGTIEVGAGPAPEAETEIDGDYNAILPIGWTIYNGDAKIQARAQREYGHLSRNNPVRMKGSFPSHPPLLPFLGGLHDHMARRTVNNPDIEHRVEQYSLSANVKELADQGHTILEDAFTDEMADELREADVRGRHWEEMVVHPWVLTLVDQSLGPGAILISPKEGPARDGTLAASWVLTDDAVAGIARGSIAISVDASTRVEADGVVTVLYGAAGSDLAACGIETADDASERNPPVFRSLCGL